MDSNTTKIAEVAASDTVQHINNSEEDDDMERNCNKDNDCCDASLPITHPQHQTNDENGDDSHHQEEEDWVRMTSTPRYYYCCASAASAPDAADTSLHSHHHHNNPTSFAASDEGAKASLPTKAPLAPSRTLMHDKFAQYFSECSLQNIDTNEAVQAMKYVQQVYNKWWISGLYPATLKKKREERRRKRQRRGSKVLPDTKKKNQKNDDATRNSTTVSSNMIMSPCQVRDDDCNLNSTTKLLETQMKETKSMLIPSLTQQSYGDASDSTPKNSDFDMVLKKLLALHDQCKSCSASSPPFSSKEADWDKLDGTWLSLSKPEYQYNSGYTTSTSTSPDSFGEENILYTLGRMSFGMFHPTNLNCTIEGVYNTISSVVAEDENEEEREIAEMGEEEGEDDGNARRFGDNGNHELSETLSLPPGIPKSLRYEVLKCVNGRKRRNEISNNCCCDSEEEKDDEEDVNDLGGLKTYNIVVAFTIQPNHQDAPSSDDKNGAKHSDFNNSPKTRSEINKSGECMNEENKGDNCCKEDDDEGGNERISVPTTVERHSQQYGIVVTDENEHDPPSSSSSSSSSSTSKQEHKITRPIRGIMSNYGYTLPDPDTPNRLSVWFTGGTIEVNDEECDMEEWRRIFASASSSSMDAAITKPISNEKDTDISINTNVSDGSDKAAPSSPSSTSANTPPHSKKEQNKACPAQQQTKAKILAARVMLGANIPHEMQSDGTLSYTLHQPIGGHGKAFCDLLYVDDTLRIMKGHSGCVYVLAKVS